MQDAIINFLAKLYSGARKLYQVIVPYDVRLAIKKQGSVEVDQPPAEEVDPGTQVIHLVKPLIETGEYRQYLDLWGEAGFHIAPDYYFLERRPFTRDALEDVHRRFLPNLFILGAAKSGTSTLHSYLEMIPTVCMSEIKEPYFFECEYHLGLDHYRQKYFSHWMGEPYIGESRHRNLYLPFVAERIHAVNPDAKLIVLVRNPIDRAYSHWWYWYSREVEPLSFEDAIKVDNDRINRGLRYFTREEEDEYCIELEASGKGLDRTYLDSGYYYEQIQQYMKFFPRDQIKVMQLSDLVENPYQFIQEIQQFLGIDYFTPDNFTVIHENPALESQEMKKPPMNTEIRKWLTNHYAEHNQRLAEFMDRDLSHWR